MNIAYQRIPVADLGNFVLSSGRAVILYGFNVIAAVTGTGPDIQFYNDANGLSDIIIQENPTADVPTTIMYPQGIVFPNGCFVDAGSASDVVQVTVFFTAL